MDEKIINSSSVPVGHAVLAQPWTASPYLAQVDPLHMVVECCGTASRSMELTLHDACNIGKLEPSRVKIDKQYCLLLAPCGPGSLVGRHA